MLLNTSYKFLSTITIRIEHNTINIMIQFSAHLFLGVTCLTLAHKNKTITLKVVLSTIMKKKPSIKTTISSSLKG